MTFATPVRTGFVISLGLAAAALYILHLATAILTERALAVDGANFLLNMLRREYAWPVMNDPDHMRLFANLLSQFPAALAIKADVEDLRLIKLLFGAGLFLTPVALSLVCVWLCHRARDYRLVVFLFASLITATLPSEQFKANPAFTAAALCWVPLAYATLRLQVHLLDQALVVIVLIALFHSYEGVAVLGPILAAAAIWRLLQSGQRRPTWETWHLHAIAAAGVALPLAVVFWQATHPVATPTERFFSHLPALLPAEMWRNTGASRISLVVTIALAAMLVALAVPALRRRLSRGFSWRNPLYLVLLATALASAALALHVALRYIAEPWHIGSSYIEYEYRTLIVFGTALWMGLAIATQRLHLTFAPIERSVAFVLATGLAAASLWQLGNTKLWHHAQQQVRHVIDHSDEPLISHEEVWQRFADVGAPWLKELHRSHWHWGTYSIAVQNKRRIERFVSYRDANFRVEHEPKSPWVLSLSWVNFHGDAYFDFNAFLANYRQSSVRQRVEHEQLLWSELQSIRTIADGRIVLSSTHDESVDPPRHQGLYHMALKEMFLAQGGGPGPRSVLGDDYLILSRRASPGSLTPTHRIVFLYEPLDFSLLHLEEYETIASTAPVVQSEFDVYWLDDGKRIAWLREPCEYTDTTPPFLFHIHPVNTADLPERRQQHGFANGDFRFQRNGGMMAEGRCWITANLPSYAIATVTTGQYDQDGVIWKVQFPGPRHDG